MSWLLALLQWMYLNVLGNLVASVIWAAPVFIWHHRRLIKHHEMQVRALHERLDLHFGDAEGPREQVPQEADHY